MAALAKGYVFVTVGTTSFDDLIQAVDTEQMAEALASKGYEGLVLQIGRGKYLPRVLVPSGYSSTNPRGFETEYFEFADSLGDFISKAALVISHAGSGSIFESLRASRPLVVVVNEKLMDNHQAELADELSQMKYCVSARPSDLLEKIKAFNPDALLPYTAGDPKKLAQGIDEFLGVPETVTTMPDGNVGKCEIQ
mmetsp:Transcript_17038/g.20533  ORF Transcript_17038/g.20533 Transcript_17038/m.20533 type:complete len:195 (-) Transcript_17038:264-848(-)